MFRFDTRVVVVGYIVNHLLLIECIYIYIYTELRETKQFVVLCEKLRIYAFIIKYFNDSHFVFDQYIPLGYHPPIFSTLKHR